MTKPAQRSLLNRPLARLVLLGFASLFIMAPTPGNVGGCSGSAGGEPVRPGNVTANPPETAEWMYFDQGLCAGFCWRLRECGVLCAALNPAHPQYPPECATDPTSANNNPPAYAQCVRGVAASNGGTTVSPLATGIFQIGECPHACPPPAPGQTDYRGQYQTAYQWDVQACSDAVATRTCASSGPGSIGNLFVDGVSECTNVCR